jgi:hypothetical protein
MKYVFIAIDPSLSSPGICVYCDEYKRDPLELSSNHPTRSRLEWHVMAQIKHKNQIQLIQQPIQGVIQFDPRWILPIYMQKNTIPKRKETKKVKLNVEYEHSKLQGGNTDIQSSIKQSSVKHTPSTDLQPIPCAFSIHVYPDAQESYHQRQIQRQTILSQKVISIIESILARYHPCCPVIAVEYYTLHMTDSSSMSTMYEIGGMIRYELTRRGLFYLDVSPSSIKSHFISGAADKLDMWKRFRQLNVLGNTSLYTLLKFKPTDDRLVRAPEKLHQEVKKRKKPQKDADPSRPVVHAEGQEKESARLVHKPIEDMVDSFALVMFLMYEWRHMNASQRMMFESWCVCNWLSQWLPRSIVAIVRQCFVY